MFNVLTSHFGCCWNFSFECNKQLYFQEGITIRKILFVLIIRFLGKYDFKICVVSTSIDQFCNEVDRLSDSRYWHQSWHSCL